jgi:hypothetical protein
MTLGDKKDVDAELSFTNPTITVNQQDAFVLPVSLRPNQYLYCDGKSVKVYSKQWQLLQTISLTKPLPVLSTGKNEILFDGQFSGDNIPDVKIELRCKGTPEALHSKTSKTL